MSCGGQARSICSRPDSISLCNATERVVASETKAAPGFLDVPGQRQNLSQRLSFVVFVGLLIIGSVRIVATYTVFSDTLDEPAHIACGMQWLDQKVYRYEPQHPPLARVMVAIGPYLAGVRLAHASDPWEEGRSILNAGNQYDRNLALARLGTLPFFWLSSLVVFLWARSSFGNVTACFSSLFFTTLPSVLAHGGLATTDMAATGTIGGAFVAMLVWAQRASWPRTVLLSAAIASAVLSKFSAVAFLPSAAFMALACRLFLERPRMEQLFKWFRSHLLPLLIALGMAWGLIWAAYRFSFEGVPAPELWQGIRDVMEHNRTGHPSYLLGQYRESGWWYYFPVALGVKTPLALLALLLGGAVLCWKRRREANGANYAPVAYALGILGFSIAFSHINLGVRQVLPLYIGLSIVAGIGAQHLWSSGWAPRVLLFGLLVWMLFSSVLSHPDYLAYFNEFAKGQPEKILVDSDLDWGQDTKRLAQRLKEAGAKQVAFDPLNQGFVNDLEMRHEFPQVKPLSPFRPMSGWNAASMTKLKLWRLGLDTRNPTTQLWTDRFPPTERIGRGILLWYCLDGTEPKCY